MRRLSGELAPARDSRRLPAEGAGPRPATSEAERFHERRLLALRHWQAGSQQVQHSANHAAVRDDRHRLPRGKALGHRGQRVPHALPEHGRRLAAGRIDRTGGGAPDLEGSQSLPFQIAEPTFPPVYA